MKDNISETELISALSFKEFLFDKIVPFNDLKDYEDNPLEKIFPFWRKKGLLPFIPSGKHFQISFAQLIWIRILDTLRMAGYPLANTKKVCDYFFKDAYYNDLPKKNVTFHLNQLDKKKKAGTITYEEDQLLKFLNESQNDDILMYLLRYDVNYLTNLILECLTLGEDRKIVIFLDGRVGVSDGFEVTNHSSYHVSLTEPHLCLSLRFYLEDFIQNKELSELFVPQILNEDEKIVLKEIRRKNIQKLVITFSEGKPMSISPTTMGKLTETETKEIKKILGLKNYQSVTIDTVDEKTFSFKKTIKDIKKFQ